MKYVAKVLAMLFSISVSSSPIEQQILFVGKTGAGKSTLINMVGHRLNNDTYDNNRSFLVPITQGELSYTASHLQGCRTVVDSMASQTDKISVFNIGDRDRNFALIDTPGLLDTDARRQQLNDQNLQAFLAAHPVNTIALVISASDMRGTADVVRFFNDFLALFPSAEEVIKNLVVLVTFSAQADENIIRLVQANLTGIEQNQFFFFDSSPLIVGPRTNRNLGQRIWDADQEEIEKLLAESRQHPALNTKLFLAHQTALAQIKGQLDIISQEIGQKNDLTMRHTNLLSEITELEKTKTITANHTTTQKVSVEVPAGTYTEKGSRHGTKRPTYTKCNKCGGQNHVCTTTQVKDVTVTNAEMKVSHEAAIKALANNQADLADLSTSLDMTKVSLSEKVKNLKTTAKRFIASTAEARINLRIINTVLSDRLANYPNSVSTDPIFMNLDQEIADDHEQKSL